MNSVAYWILGIFFGFLFFKQTEESHKDYLRLGKEDKNIAKEFFVSGFLFIIRILVLMVIIYKLFF